LRCLYGYLYYLRDFRWLFCHFLCYWHFIIHFHCWAFSAAMLLYFIIFDCVIIDAYFISHAYFAYWFSFSLLFFHYFLLISLDYWFFDIFASYFRYISSFLLHFTIFRFLFILFINTMIIFRFISDIDFYLCPFHFSSYTFRHFSLFSFSGWRHFHSPFHVTTYYSLPISTLLFHFFDFASSFAFIAADIFDIFISFSDFDCFALYFFDTTSYCLILFAFAIDAIKIRHIFHFFLFFDIFISLLLLMFSFLWPLFSRHWFIVSPFLFYNIFSFSVFLLFSYLHFFTYTIFSRYYIFDFFFASFRLLLFSLDIATVICFFFAGWRHFANYITLFFQLTPMPLFSHFHFAMIHCRLFFFIFTLPRYIAAIIFSLFIIITIFHIRWFSFIFYYHWHYFSSSFSLSFSIIMPYTIFHFRWC